MAVRTRDWLKFGALVALAFVFGLAFASTLGLPKKGGAAESIVATQPVAPPVQIAVAKSVADLSNGFVSVAEHVNASPNRSEEHTSELQSRLHLVCRLLLEKKKKNIINPPNAIVYESNDSD